MATRQTVTTKQAAALLGVDPWQIHQWGSRGRLTRIGARKRGTYEARWYLDELERVHAERVGVQLMIDIEANL